MENKTEDSKSEVCGKFAWCKHPHVMIPLVSLILLIVAFGAGIAVGHELGDGRERGEGGRGWGGGGCMGGNFSQWGRGYQSKDVNDQGDIQENELNNVSGGNVKEQAETGNKAEGEESTSTIQNSKATSTVTK